MHKHIIYLLAFFITQLTLTLNIKAVDLTTSFTQGSGSKYNIYFQSGGEATTDIYIAKVTKTEIDVEFFIEQFPSKLWQRFSLISTSDGGLTLNEGFFLSDDMKAPEKLDKETLKGRDGAFMTDFLVKDKNELLGTLIGKEDIKTAAGNINALHYQKKSGTQTIDYWIADEIKPLKIAKLQSKGPKNHQNYTMILLSLIKNITPTIKPEKAIPLTSETKSLLDKALF